MDKYFGNEVMDELYKESMPSVFDNNELMELVNENCIISGKLKNQLDDEHRKLLQKLEGNYGKYNEVNNKLIFKKAFFKCVKFMKFLITESE